MSSRKWKMRRHKILMSLKDLPRDQWDEWNLSYSRKYGYINRIFKNII